MIELYFEGNIKLEEWEIENAGGDFGQAAQNAIGSTGAKVDRCTDEYDNYTLQQHEESLLCD